MSAGGAWAEAALFGARARSGTLTCTHRGMGAQRRPASSPLAAALRSRRASAPAVPKFRSDSLALCAFRELGGGSGATRLRCTVIGEGGVRGLSGWANAEGSEHTDVSASLGLQTLQDLSEA